MTARSAPKAVLRLLAVVGLMAGFSAAHAAETVAAPGASLPQKPEEVVAYITTALTAHDLGAFERIVEWKGARAFRKRMTLAQIRYSFGRPIKSAILEPFPADGFDQARSMLDLSPNLPVTEQLKVVFDEPPATADSGPPTSVFLLGKEDGQYRIGLLLAKGPPK